MPRLEGTAHVNMALVLKFIPNFLFNQSDSLPVIEKRRDATDDTFLFHQGQAKGLSKIQFAPWRPVYEEFAHLPNVARFTEQADALGTLMTTAPPTGEQLTDLDFMLAVGELFTLVPYGQLILEEAKLRGADADLIDEIFGVFVRDFSAYAVALHGKTTSTEAQQQWALAQVRKPVRDDERTARIFEQVRALAGTYEMNP
jgi:acyl-CoA dehydrogenase